MLGLFALIALVAYREPTRRLVLSIALIFATILVALGWFAAGLAHQPFSLGFGAFVLFLFESGCLIWLALTQPPRRRRWVAAVATGIILVGPGVSVFVLPSVDFEIAYVQCGHNPVIGADAIFGQKTYYLPGDDAYDLSAGSNYYCSAAEAEAAGYSPR